MITTEPVRVAQTGGGKSLPSTTLARLAGPSLRLGGLAWMGMYGLEIVVGLTTGKSLTPSQFATHLSTFVRVDHVALSGGGILVALGLLGLYARLRGRARGFGIASVALAIVTVLTGASALVLTDILGQAAAASSLGFPELLSVLLSATLMAIAAKRARALPRWASTVLLLAGVLTFPLAVATVPIGHIIPDWILDNLPLALGGAGFSAVGAALSSGRDGVAPPDGR